MSFSFRVWIMSFSFRFIKLALFDIFALFHSLMWHFMELHSKAWFFLHCSDLIEIKKSSYESWFSFRIILWVFQSDMLLKINNLRTVEEWENRRNWHFTIIASCKQQCTYELLLNGNCHGKIFSNSFGLIQVQCVHKNIKSRHR